MNCVYHRLILSTYHIPLDAVDWMGVTFVANAMAYVLPMRADLVFSAAYYKRTKGLAYVKSVSMAAGNIVFGVVFALAQMFVSLLLTGDAGRNVVRRTMAPVGRGHAGRWPDSSPFTAGAGPRRARADPGEAAGRCGAGLQRPPKKPVAAVASAGLSGREQCRSALPVHGLLRGHRDAGHGISGAVL